MSRPSTELLTVILAVPDPASVSPGLRAALERDRGLSVVAEKSTSTRALGSVLVHRPNVCLIDADLPGDLEATIKSILRERPETRIGILARSADQPGLVRPVLAGADGVLLMNESPATFAAEVYALARGERVLPPEPATTPAPEPAIETADPGWAGLSDQPEPDHEEQRSDQEEVAASLGTRTPVVPREGSSEDRLTATILYVPRFSRHLRRRLRARMPLSVAWESARERMWDYR